MNNNTAAARSDIRSALLALWAAEHPDQQDPDGCREDEVAEWLFSLIR